MRKNRTGGTARPTSPNGTPLGTHNNLRRLNGQPAHTEAQMRAHDKTRDMVDRATRERDPVKKAAMWDWIKTHGTH